MVHHMDATTYPKAPPLQLPARCLDCASRGRANCWYHRHADLTPEQHREMYLDALVKEADRLVAAHGLPVQDRTLVVKVPPRFLEDHLDRGLAAGLRWAWNKTSVTLVASPAELGELLADARYYVEMADAYGPDFRGLVSSARATVARLVKVLGEGA